MGEKSSHICSLCTGKTYLKCCRFWQTVSRTFLNGKKSPRRAARATVTLEGAATSKIHESPAWKPQQENKNQAGEGRTSERAIGLLTDVLGSTTEWQCLVHAEGKASRGEHKQEGRPSWAHWPLPACPLTSYFSQRKPEEHQKGEPVSW